METIAVIVPVMKNFRGFTELMASIDTPVVPIVIDNWTENRGVPKAWNEGLRRAQEYDYAVILNDDVILTPGALPELCGYLDDTYVLASLRNTGIHHHPYGLNYWGFAVRPADFVEKMGFFDENFIPAYYEDDDMQRRIDLSVYRSINTQIPALHKTWGTQKMDGRPVVTDAQWKANLAYYTRKWGGPPREERFYLPFNNKSKDLKDW